MELLNTQAVLFIYMVSGIICRKAEIIKKNDVKSIANLLYYLFIPALFFSRISSTNLLEIRPAILAGSLLPVISLMLILFLLKIFSVISRDTFLLLNLTICFGSNAFFGIPFFTSLYGDAGHEFSVTASVFLGVFGIFTTTLLFEFYSGSGKKRRAFLALFRNPILLSISAGILFSVTGIKINIIETVAASFGAMTNVLAIIILGMFVYDNFSRAVLVQAIGFALFRLLCLPAVTIGIVLLFFNHGTPDTGFLIIQSGIPVAVSIAVYADRYEWKKELLANIVVVTSAMSFFSLTLLYLAVKYLFSQG